MGGITVYLWNRVIEGDKVGFRSHGKFWESYWYDWCFIRLVIEWPSNKWCPPWTIKSYSLLTMSQLLSNHTVYITLHFMRSEGDFGIHGCPEGDFWAFHSSIHDLETMKLLGISASQTGDSLNRELWWTLSLLQLDQSAWFGSPNKTRNQPMWHRLSIAKCWKSYWGSLWLSNI